MNPDDKNGNNGNNNYDKNYTVPPPPQPPYQGRYFEPTVDKLMSTKDWIITYLIQCIPCVGIIMTFIWAFSNDNLTRRNYCRAILIISGIALGVCIVLMIFMAMIGLLIYNYYYW